MTKRPLNPLAVARLSIVLEQPCPFCYAPAKEPCRSPSGREYDLTRTHAQRHQAMSDEQWNRYLSDRQEN